MDPSSSSYRTCDDTIAEGPASTGLGAAAATESTLAVQVMAVSAENRQLRAEIERLRADRNNMADIQRRAMELLETPSPERLLHDLRNVLNERELLRALADPEI